jgi:ribosome-associated toxin RatA of RatAB toxin-antitoxin module
MTRASLTVGLKGLRQSFTTQNDNRAGEAIDMRLLEGPFRSFSASWRFSVLAAGACKIDFALEYEFSSRALARLLEPLFDRIADTMVDAFARRADEVHGAAKS